MEDAVTFDILMKHLDKDNIMTEITNHIEKGHERASKELVAMGYKQVIKDISITAGGLLMKGDRLVIPKSLVRNVLEAAHEGHPGKESMTRQLRQSVWWLGMTSDVKEYVGSCTPCLASV